MRIVQKHRLLTLMALLGWSGLAIQLDMVLLARWTSGASLLGGLVNYFSFFTILTNTLVATVLTYAADTRSSKGRTFFLQPWVSSGIGVSIIVVGVAYNLLLRNLWQPQGLQWLANELLHDVMPVLFTLYWWCCVPKGTLRLSYIGLWGLYPIVYFAYILLRGHLLGVYPYPFIDVEKLGYAQTFVNAFGILAGFVFVALVVVVIDRWRGRQTV
ncbi:Pr6Pr family membrane protein [Pseudomonas sp. CCC3.1]|uniref:Pr6Pr family membrane protein n=1 Tax=Pseudomonas sp. CCC3.1 TaxID=3048607 RepID=UPI002AC9E133|nr:Pr6Pr family membrane protein [Pseudomonas sp. CCC3.1]MEB0206354.1 Pr6Pr family membrane protein [Pseudomonas sp. CCC3.1]WPX37158.1 Pr6Pr family membrane protein [Pseudomonas sp. CCC3.1]